jgi:UDP-N-acetylmuramoyl-L-alanyl-D-glutamate--2,6-diaminopimelate ligase
LVEPGRRIITVLGCGGDRDRSKRPLMGRAAQQGSELTVVTSDNPRTEDPLAIIRDITEGLDAQGHATRVEPDRAAAIRLAVNAAEPGDIVLIAGKGHEDYQLVGDQVLHFSDVEEAAAVLAG